ncbi:MAG: hypothetical protein ACPF9D_13885 [Owenweeksia sp.]
MSKPDYEFLYMMAVAQLYEVKGAVNALIELGPEHYANGVLSVKGTIEENIEFLENKEKQHEPI